MRLDSLLQRTGEILSGRPRLISPTTPCIEVIERLRDTPDDVALVVDAAQRPLGWLGAREIGSPPAGDAAMTAESRMIRTEVSVDVDALLLDAVATMRRNSLKFLPVVDADGRAVGILSLDRARGALAADLIDPLLPACGADDVDTLRAAKQARIGVVGDWLRQGLPVTAIQGLLAGLDRALYRRVAEICLAQQRRAGHGAPPVDFDLIVMGSAGRGESLLHPDQDNGLILADYPAREHPRIDAWFVEFSACLVATLARVGFPRCSGQVMATNPLWRKTLPEWRRQIGIWAGRAEPPGLRMCDIFFDFSPRYGRGALAVELRGHVAAITHHPVFLRELYRTDEEHGVALGLFGRLRTDPLAGPHHGEIHLKLTGLLPLVGTVRILALREGLSETGTLARIDALRARQVLEADEHDALGAAYRQIVFLLLRQQIRDLESGRPSGHHVPLQALSTREHRELVASFKAIRRLRSWVHEELSAGLD